MSKIKGIKYIGPCLDSSGYAQATRDYILALYKAGVPITVKPISFENTRPDFGEDGKILKSLINKDIDYNVVVVQTTPEFWSSHKEEGKFNVGYTVWETDKLHPSWPDYINNNVNKVLVPCDWNAEVFKDSGVNVPIGVVPHTINKNKLVAKSKNIIGNIADDTYVFYCINQWTERKNFLATIKAYWYAFQNNENVALVLKTYRSNYSEQEKDIIRQTIQRLKTIMPMEKYPPIYLILDLLSDDDIINLHNRGNCYLSLDRGEGWGLSTFTAGALGNPVITTNFGGVLQYLNKDNSFLVDCIKTPVFGMPYTPWYLGNMCWADASPVHAAKFMRYVYNNPKEASEVGCVLKDHINTNFNYEVIGKKYIKEIEEIL